MWPEGSTDFGENVLVPRYCCWMGACVRASAHMHTSVYVGAHVCICVCAHAFLCICGYVCLFFRCRVPVLSPPPSPVRTFSLQYPGLPCGVTRVHLAAAGRPQRMHRPEAWSQASWPSLGRGGPLKGALGLSGGQLVQAWVGLPFLPPGKGRGMSTMCPRLLWPRRVQGENLAQGRELLPLLRWTELGEYTGQERIWDTKRPAGHNVSDTEAQLPNLLGLLHFFSPSPSPRPSVSLRLSKWASPSPPPPPSRLLSASPSGSGRWWARCSRNGNQTWATPVPNAVCTTGSL